MMHEMTQFSVVFRSFLLVHLLAYAKPPSKTIARWGGYLRLAPIGDILICVFLKIEI